VTTAGSLPERDIRRRLRQAVGVLWVIDGVLQLQPFMWIHRFGSETLNSAAEGQPGLVAASIRAVADVVAAHPVACNAVFAGLQLAIGMALLASRSPRQARRACTASLLWALGVWVFGEGLGGVLSGHTSLTVGAPAAALLYALVTAAAWPGSRRPASGVALAWLSVWAAGAVLQALPAERTGVGLGDQVDMAAMMSPAALARPEVHLAVWLAGLSTLAAALLTAALTTTFLAIGAGVLGGDRLRRVAVSAGMGLSAVFWVICQNFGGISTAAATDPGSAPVVVLLEYSAFHAKHRSLE
jgi:hypothetical protein